MKDINNFISEKLVINKDTKISSSNEKDYWTSKLIPKKDILKFGLEALKQTKIFASDIQDELGRYKDPDNLQQAYENEELVQYLIWENKLAELLSEDDKYGGDEGDICSDVWTHAYDLLDELIY